jgi:hypothetical protein
MYLGNDLLSPVVMVFIGLAVVFGIFLLLRKVFLWYYRIDDAVTAMERMALALEKIYYSVEDRKKEAKLTERYTNPEAVAKIMGQKRE